MEFGSDAYFLAPLVSDQAINKLELLASAEIQNLIFS